MKSENDQLGERIATLESIVRELMTRFSSLGLGNMDSAAGGGAAIGGPVGCVELPEPTPRTAFAVRWNAETEKWFMYLPGDCLLCDGVTPGGIFDTGEEYDIPDGWTGIGIRATWTVDKKTGEVTDPNADISQSLKSKGKVTDSDSTYSVEYNFPVAKIVDNEVIQITSGFVSLESHIPTKDGKLTIKDSDGNELGTFTANQESDVTITVSSKKPNNGKLTFKFDDGSSDAEFTANQPDNTPVEVTIPKSPGKGVLTIRASDGAELAKFSADQEENDPVEVVIPAAANDGKLKVKFGEDAAVDKFSANQQGDSTLELAKVASTGSYGDLKYPPTIPAAANDGKLKVKFGEDAAVDKFSANQQGDSTLELAKVASTGSYGDLKDPPTIPAAANDGKLKVKFGEDAAVDKFSANQQGDSTLELAKVASTGSYGDLKDQPTIPAVPTELKFVGENGLRYDTESRQLQIRVDTLSFLTGIVTPGTWKMIIGGQAVPHQLTGTI